MKYRLLNFITCPECKSELNLEIFKIKEFARIIQNANLDRFCKKCNSGSWIVLPKCKSWQYHLSEMVLKKEPLKYLEKFL